MTIQIHRVIHRLAIAVIVAFMRAALASESERDQESYDALGSELRNPFRLPTKH